MIEVGLGWLNHPMALGGDSTTHISPKKERKKVMLRFWPFKVFICLFLIMHKDTCRFFKVCDVDFCQFFNESWMEVSSPSLAINDVLSTIRNEP